MILLNNVDSEVMSNKLSDENANKIVLNVMVNKKRFRCDVKQSSSMRWQTK